MRLLFIALSTLALAFVSEIATADCNVRVENAYIPEPPPGSNVAAAYFIVANDCDSPTVLVGVEAEGDVSASLHRSSTQDGISRMKPVERIAVDENASVAFSPGGLHVMLHGAELEAGHALQLRLVLEDGRRIQVLAEVRSRADSADPQHHEHHSGGGE